MSFLIRLSVLLLISSQAFAQRLDSVSYGNKWLSPAKADSLSVDSVRHIFIIDGKEKIYQLPAGRSATYPGRYPALNTDFNKGFKYPEQTNKTQSGTIRIGFIVERDSTLTSFEILKSFDPLAAQAVIQTLKSIKKWIPAEQGGFLVRQRINLSFWIPAKEGY